MPLSSPPNVSTRRALRRVVLFGDSITDVCGGPRLDGSVQSYLPNGYWTWASIFLKKRFQFVMNAGVSGNNTSNMLARIESDVIAYTPDIVVIPAGVNDLSGVTDSSSRATAVATVKANLGSIYSRVNAAGALSVAVPVMPTSNFTHLTNTHARQAVSEVNLWIKQQQYARPNLVVCDMGLGFGDMRTNGEIIYANIDSNHPDYTTDGLHPGASAAINAGYILSQTLEPFASGDNLMMPYNDAVNLLTDPAMTGASGTTKPTSWTWNRIGGSGDATFTYVDRTDAVGGTAGKWLEIDMPSNHQGTLSQFGNTIATGEKYIGMVEYDQVSIGGTAGRAICLDIDLRAPNASSQFRRQDAGVDALNSGGTDRIVDYRLSLRSGVLMTPELTVPVGANGGFINFDIKIFGQGVMRIGRVSLVKVN